jgi:ubiquinone/menaquinone biosynthesis C-methylase UbiE
VNGNITAEAYRRLGPGSGMHVMAIGFGNGHLLPDLLRLAPDLLYSGIDISPTMVDEARRFNSALVNSGRAAFHLADAARISAADASLDRVLAINVIYILVRSGRPAAGNSPRPAPGRRQSDHRRNVPDGGRQ